MEEYHPFSQRTNDGAFHGGRPRPSRLKVGPPGGAPPGRVQEPGRQPAQ